jgi:hypothetical protein
LANRIRKKSHAVLQLRDAPSIEIMRIADSLAGTDRAREIRDVIDASLGDASPKPRARSTTPVGEVDLSVASAQERCRREDERSSVL